MKIITFLLIASVVLTSLFSLITAAPLSKEASIQLSQTTATTIPLTRKQINIPSHAKRGELIRRGASKVSAGDQDPNRAPMLMVAFSWVAEAYVGSQSVSIIPDTGSFLTVLSEGLYKPGPTAQDMKKKANFGFVSAPNVTAQMYLDNISFGGINASKVAVARAIGDSGLTAADKEVAGVLGLDFNGKSKSAPSFLEIVTKDKNLGGRGFTFDIASDGSGVLIMNYLVPAGKGKSSSSSSSGDKRNYHVHGHGHSHGHSKTVGKETNSTNPTNSTSTTTPTNSTIPTDSSNSTTPATGKGEMVYHKTNKANSWVLTGSLAGVKSSEILPDTGAAQVTLPKSALYTVAKALNLKVLENKDSGEYQLVGDCNSDPRPTFQFGDQELYIPKQLFWRTDYMAGEECIANLAGLDSEGLEQTWLLGE